MFWGLPPPLNFMSQNPGFFNLDIIQSILNICYKRFRVMQLWHLINPQNKLILILLLKGEKTWLKLSSAKKEMYQFM